MKNAFVLCVGLFGLFFSVHAQVRDLPGYIVRNSGDTLRGLLREQGTDESAKRISFRATAADSDYQVYTPNEVKSYQYTDGNLFRAITFPDTRKEGVVSETVYGKLLVGGEFDLYTFTEGDVLYFLVRKDTGFYLLYDDDIHAAPYVKGNFRNELNFFATSCDASNWNIEAMNYSIRTMMNFFQKLDACVNPGRAVADYYHKAKVNAHVYAYFGGMPLGISSQYSGEIRLRLIWPQVNPNASINIGLRYTDLKRRVHDPDFAATYAIWNHEEYQIKSLPLTVEYNLTRGVVRPFIFAGISLCTVNMLTDNPELIGANVYYHRYTAAPVGGLGVEARLVRVLWIRAEWHYEVMTEYPTIGLALSLP